ncbi:MAG: Pycsar system effector family protein [Bacteroidota bacterium]
MAESGTQAHEEIISPPIMEVDKALLAEVEVYATDLLTSSLQQGFSYHTITHTRQVVYACREIGVNCGLTASELDILVLAAWFHDLGYLTCYDGHEEESMRMADEFFLKKGLPVEVCTSIIQLIEATKLDHAPRNLMEKVIKDADLYNLSTPEALKNSDNLRSEWVLFRQMELSDKKWEKLNLNFYRQHIYYTDYGKEVLEGRKEKNIKKLRKRIRKLKRADKEAQAALAKELHKKELQIGKLNRKVDKIKTQRPDRGIETMFRATYRTHINLSSIADNKANILLSINAIIISIVFTSLIQAEEVFVIYPSFTILLVCLTTIVFAILSTRPKVNEGVFTREDIIQKRTNLLFFGNFHSMGLDDFLWGIDQMMQDSEYLYGSMAKDIYFLGKVLAKKFRLLRLSYNMFMYGMISSVILFAILYILSTSGQI